MNDINTTRSARDAGSSEHDVEIGDPGGNIVVKQDVDVTWTNSGRYGGSGTNK